MTSKKSLWILGLVTAAIFGALALIDGRLGATGGPGIVEFEVAFTPERAQEIMALWGSEGQRDALWSLLLDFPALVAYGAFFWAAVRATRDLAVRRGWSGLARVGTILALVPVVAAACDGIEDLLLIGVLQGYSDGAASVFLAGAFATVKFVLLVVTITYLFTGLVTRFQQRR